MMEILFGNELLRCDLSVLPQKVATRDLDNCLPLEEWGLQGLERASKCLIRTRGGDSVENWRVAGLVERHCLPSIGPLQDAVMSQINHPCLPLSRLLHPMLWQQEATLQFR
jgi:hypothetical protein